MTSTSLRGTRQAAQRPAEESLRKSLRRRTPCSRGTDRQTIDQLEGKLWVAWEATSVLGESRDELEEDLEEKTTVIRLRRTAGQ